MFHPSNSPVIRMSHTNGIRLIGFAAGIVHSQDIIFEFDYAGGHDCVVAFPRECCGHYWVDSCRLDLRIKIGGMFENGGGKMREGKSKWKGKGQGIDLGCG